MFLAYVLGAAGSGKTSLLRAFVGKGFDEEAIESSRVAARGHGGTRGGGHVTAITTNGMTSGRGKDKSVVNCVEEGGGERYLVVSFRHFSPRACAIASSPQQRIHRLHVKFEVRNSPHDTLPQLQEFGSTYESEVLRNKKKLELADVLIFVYDSSDTNSFSYVSNLRVRVAHRRHRFVAAPR